VDTVPGKVGQFDVEVDGKLVFSKATAGRFPDHAEVLSQIPKEQPAQR
jgi:selT/selW/selH-like putative selenoprotein